MHVNVRAREVHTNVHIAMLCCAGADDSKKGGAPLPRPTHTCTLVTSCTVVYCRFAATCENVSRTLA